MTRLLSNWLDGYMQYVDDSEPPELYHQWCGISTIASVLQRKCMLNLEQGKTVWPNLYVVLVGPVIGKTTAMNYARALHKGIPNIHKAPNSTTLPALVQGMKAKFFTNDIFDETYSLFRAKEA